MGDPHVPVRSHHKELVKQGADMVVKLG